MMNPAKELARKWSWLSAQADFRSSPIRTISRFISWAVRCAIRKRTIVEIRKWNLKMLLPPRWKGVAKLIFVFRENCESELNYLETILSAGKTFVDAGANLGIYTLVASRMVGRSGRVVAFEPSAQSFPLLEHNISLNGFTNVQAFPIALSAQAGEAFLYHGDDPGKNSLGNDPCGECRGETVVTRSLDEALQEASAERVDVIKMDVEGAEELVLLGAKRVVRAHRPMVVLSLIRKPVAVLAYPRVLPGICSRRWTTNSLHWNRMGHYLALKVMPMALDNVVAIPRGRNRQWLQTGAPADLRTIGSELLKGRETYLLMNRHTA